MPRSSLPPTLPDSVLDWEATIYRDSFKHFISAFWEQVSGAGHLIHNWHIDFLAGELERTTFNVKANLPRVHDIVVNVPFGCSKSSIISILFPAWVWTFFPEARFISGTHTKELALDLAVKSKGVILSEKYQTLYPHVKLVKDTEGYFINTFGGDRLTCTVGGVTPTGFHAHWILIDDPIDPQGARSELELDTAKKFMTEIIPGRKVDKDASVTVLVMQRLEYRDPTAVMLKLAEDPNVTPVRHVCLPGELSEDVSPPLEEIRESFPQAYIFDDLLDSKRLSRRVLNGYRVTLGNSYWSQIMQKPTPPGGGMFKVQYFINRVKAAPYEARRIRYWDRACLVGGTLICTNEGQIPIEDVKCGHKVYTRQEWKRVVWSGQTGVEKPSELVKMEFKLPRNSEVFMRLMGTKDHKIWTKNLGFVSLGSIQGKDDEIGLLVMSYLEDLPVYDFPVHANDDPVPVYDLEVEDAHEFYANGVLVHNSTQDGGCYTAGVLMAKDKDGFYYVEHVVHGQWEPFQRNAIIASTALRDRVRYGPKWEPVVWIEEETGSTGKESFQRMAAQLSGYQVRSDKPTGSKDTRADPWSSACAAAIVKIVDNGESKNWGKSDWDVEGFVLEHCLFKPEPGKRMGGFKDQVDAAGGAYNLLSGLKTGEGMRVFTIGESRHKGLRIVVCSRDNIAQTVTQHSALLISIQDPFVMSEKEMHIDSEGSFPNGSTNGMAKTLCDNGAGGQLVPNPPAHGLSRCLGSLVLQFVDIAPKEYQDKWDELIQPWNKKPEDLQMSRDDGKKLWAFLLKKRDPNPDVIVIQDDDDRRALSIAYSICDVLHLPRIIIHVVSNEEMSHKNKEAPNEHVYNVSKLGRSMVVG